VPFITIGNINKKTYEIDFSDSFMVSEDYYKKLKPEKRPLKGDVLYTVTGSYGIPVLVNEEKKFCFQRHIGLIRPKKTTDSTWLSYLLLSNQVFSQADCGATGTAQKTVSLNVLRNLSVPDLTISEQQIVAMGVKNYREETKHLDSLYRRKLAALDELKQALLHRAFNGEL
jgi:type I restriction enzyme S subunit